MRTWRCLAVRLFACLWVASAGCAPAAPSAATPGAQPTGAAAAPASSGERPPASSSVAREPVPIESGVVSLTLGYWPTWVAEALGFFADESIQHETTVSRAMPAGLSALAGGSIQLFGGSLTATIQAIERGGDLVVVAANQNDPAYSLIARPDIATVEELRGRTVAVSALNGGDTVVLLRRMLPARGLRENDVDLILVGGTPERYAALTSGGAAATLLLQPQDFQALAQGYRRLMLSSEVLQEYVFNAWIARRDWARAHDDALVRWIRAHARALRWLNDPANREPAIAIGAERTRTEPELVRQTYDLYFSPPPSRVIPPDPSLDLHGMRVVLDDMVAAGDLPAPAPPPEKYLDTSYLERAQAR